MRFCHDRIIAGTVLTRPSHAVTVEHVTVRTSYDASADGVGTLGDGVMLPKRFTATFEDEPLPYRVVLTIALDGRRLVCERAVCERGEDSEPITSEGLRKLPVAALITSAAQQVLWSGWYSQDTGDGSEQDVTMIPAPPVPDDIAEHGPTTQALMHVARQYRLAHAAGMAPTNAVADRLGLSRSTAGRWVMLAREQGYLGATTSGRAGEQESA